MKAHHLLGHLPYLAALYRSQSFTKAAASLHVSQTAMTYQIKQLETKLSCTVVMRQSGAKIRFTADGEALVKEYMVCEQRLDLAVQALQHSEGRGVLRLSTPVDFGSILMPKLLAMIEIMAPELVVELHSGDELVDLGHQRWDVAIRGSIDPVDDALFVSPISLLASRDYAEMHGLPASLDDLREHRVLVRQGSEGRSWSRLYQERPRLTKLLMLGNTLGMREAAREGLGIALLPEFVAAQEISRGQLIKILPNATSNLNVHFCIQRIESQQTQSYEKLLREAARRILLEPDWQKQELADVV